MSSDKKIGYWVKPFLLKVTATIVFQIQDKVKRVNCLRLLVIYGCYILREGIPDLTGIKCYLYDSKVSDMSRTV